MRTMKKAVSFALALTLCLGEPCVAQAFCAENREAAIQELDAVAPQQARSQTELEPAGQQGNQELTEETDSKRDVSEILGGTEGQQGDGQDVPEIPDGTGTAGPEGQQGQEPVQGQEGPEEEEAPEPAEFLPEGMALANGADAVLPAVRGLGYDAASGMVTWQPVELAEEYQIEVMDNATKKVVATTTAKTGQASLKEFDFTIGQAYTVQVTARTEQKITILEIAKGADASLAQKSDGFFTDDSRTWYYYYQFVTSPAASLVTVASPAQTRTVTAVAEIALKQQTDGYYGFSVLPATMQDTEYIRVEYSNNKDFKNSGKNFAYEAEKAGDAISQSVRAGDGHVTRGYHRYMAKDNTYRAYLGYFSPGSTIYVRARIYNSGYRLKGEELAEQKFSSYKVLAYKIPEIEMGAVSTTVTADSITLRPSLDAGWATGYEFQKKVDGKWAKLAKQTGEASYKDSGLKAGETYYYRVRGYVYNQKAKKTTYTDWQKVSARTWGNALQLKAEANGSDSVRLTWKKAKGCKGYKIYRCDTLSTGYTMSDGGYIEDFADFTLVAAIKNSSKTSYTDKKLTPGKRYLYVVCAYREKDGKTSYLQESASIRLSANEKMAFTETSYTSAGNYTVKWNKMTGIKGYKVQKKDAATRLYKPYKTLKASATKLTLPKVKAGGAAVAYRIFPYTKKKELPAKGAEFTVAPTLGMVKNVKAAAASNGIKISWDRVSGADYYEVYRCSGDDYSYDSASKTYQVDLGKAVLVEAVSLQTESALKVKPIDTNVALDGTISYEYENEDVYGYAIDASGQAVPALFDAKQTVITSKITGNSVTDSTVAVKGLVPKTEEQLSLSKDTGAFREYAKDTAGVLETAEATLREGPRKGKAYYYVVRAVAQGQNGAPDASSVGFSKPASAVYTSTSVSAATKVKARNTMEEYAVISYKAAKNADGYMIYRSEKKNSGYKLLATTSKTIYRDTTTKSGETYYYKIVAYRTNESGARVYSQQTKPVKIKIKKEDISVLDLMLEQ